MLPVATMAMKIPILLFLLHYCMYGTRRAFIPLATRIKIKICCNNNKKLTMDLDGEELFPSIYPLFIVSTQQK
jgi:hypothetical protein